jgi:hypothetical protein
MRDLLSLPDEILKLVMQHLPLKDRFTSCCLVHTRFHTAAVRAGALSLADIPPVRSQERAESVMGWLDQHGEHLTSLKVTEFPQTIKQQPRRQGITPIATPMSLSEALDEIKRHCGERRSLDITAQSPRLWAALAAAGLATQLKVILQYWEQQQAVRNCITCELEGSEHAHVWSLLLVGSQDLGCERTSRPATLGCLTC